ncbi:MAG TPA: hypothetical protein VND19_15320 [Acetobacteraceae bacterium]|nr:hypothetical protein [Acetobacteraceae bacterium]
MRLLPMLLVLPLLALQAHAQTAPPRPAAPAAIASAPLAPARAAPRYRHMTWQQRFAEANVAHDGHLTLREARAGYVTVARHFKKIDAGKKGYVTVDDLNAWHKQQRATRHSRHGRTGKRRSRSVSRRRATEPGRINTSANGKALSMTWPEAPSAGLQATAK